MWEVARTDFVGWLYIIWIERQLTEMNQYLIFLLYSVFGAQFPGSEVQSTHSLMYKCSQRQNTSHIMDETNVSVLLLRGSVSKIKYESHFKMKT